MTDKFKEIFRSETTRLKSWDYAFEGYYFVTICEKSRNIVFGDICDGTVSLTPLGCAAMDCWTAIPEHFPFVGLDAFCIMPNHVHGIIVIKSDGSPVETKNFASLRCDNPGNKFGPQSKNLASIVRGFKIGVTKFARENDIDFAWQPRYHDRIIRNERELFAIRTYICNNPVEWAQDEYATFFGNSVNCRDAKFCVSTDADSAAGSISIRRIIMSKIGRNDLCPCGSGEKYKKCCLKKDESIETLQREEEQAMQMALDWLVETYSDEVSQALYEGFFGELTEEDEERLNELPSGLQRMVRVNSIEWILADGELIIDGTPMRALDLIFGANGPLLPAHGAEWLKARGECAMSLFEVRETQPGEGLWIADLLQPDAEPVWVSERTASKSLVRWDIFGARLVCQGDLLTFSGALYPFDRQEGIDCRDEILELIKSEKPCDEDKRFLVGAVIIDTWLMGLLADEEPLPELVDASTGDKLLLTTDHYRVADARKLEQILAAQQDVDGDREDGWNRFVELDDGRCRSLASLVLKKRDMLEVGCRTPGLTDDARTWLEGIAGDVVTFRIRDVVDPRSEKARESSRPQPEPDIPKELQRQIIHQYLAKHYETWPEIPLPALNGKTPLAAVKNKRLRPKVIELLKSIDQLEMRRIEQTGGKPFDVTFLWERLGVER